MTVMSGFHLSTHCHVWIHVSSWWASQCTRWQGFCLKCVKPP